MRPRTPRGLILGCEDGHEYFQPLDPAVPRAAALSYAALLDGSSGEYLDDPREERASLIGRCSLASCGARLRTAVLGYDDELDADAIQEIRGVIFELDRETHRSPVSDLEAHAHLRRLVGELLPRWCDGLRNALIPPPPRRPDRL